MFFSTSDNENKSIAFNFWQTCLFGIDIDSDEIPQKNLEKNIMKNAIALENLKRIREFEERLRLALIKVLIKPYYYLLRSYTVNGKGLIFLRVSCFIFLIRSTCI